MDAYRAIVGKRDTRAYLDQPIPDDVVHRILTAGRMAGSSKNSQPCRFIVMRERESIEALAACGQWTTPMRTAPLVIAIMLEKGWRPFDAGRSAQNMMIAAWAEGVTSCPVGIQDEQCGRRAVGAPEDFEVHMVIAFGYPDPAVPRSRGMPRKTLVDIVYSERWQEP